MGMKLEPWGKGEENRNAKLTDDDVRLIRRLFREGKSPKAIHREHFPKFAISLVRQVISGRRWGHLEG